MCGICGAVAFTDKGISALEKIEKAVDALKHRGPDGTGVFRHGCMALGHTRLSIIDPTEAAAQPFTDATGRYTIIYNGEFYNFKEHRKFLENKGVVFRSQSDTEVLLNLYLREGPACLEKVNGIFAFAIYDKQEEALFLARDRFGIKPLLCYRDEEVFIFASEMKALLCFNMPRVLDYASIHAYLQLNYIPEPLSVFRNVRKLPPGSYIKIRGKEVVENTYYCLPARKAIAKDFSINDLQGKLFGLMERAVQNQLVADVPLGVFLSGGVDSSVITALAARQKRELISFSIGYRNAPFFDETLFAEMVAKHCKTKHTVFYLSEDDLCASLHEVLDSIDEPFGDSSAIPLYILSKNVRKHVSAVLSGDGGDELFGGYNKHYAEYQLRNNPMWKLMGYTGSLWRLLPQSRNNRLGNYIRQLQRLSDGAKLPAGERYWRWASILDERGAARLLNAQRLQGTGDDLSQIRKEFISLLKGGSDMNEVFRADFSLVLLSDMLRKVDMMSMAHGLEVRVPFLDHEMVQLVFAMPSAVKIDRRARKKILKETFRHLLPPEILSRPKHGFEVPLLRWFRTGLRSLICDDLLSESFIREQGIFDWEGIDKLRRKLFSSSPGDAPATCWGMLVFQEWWRKYGNS